MATVTIDEQVDRLAEVVDLLERLSQDPRLGAPELGRQAAAMAAYLTDRVQTEAALAERLRELRHYLYGKAVELDQKYADGLDDTGLGQRVTRTMAQAGSQAYKDCLARLDRAVFEP